MTSTNPNHNVGYRDVVVLQGYHKKLKTMKKKYFVLYAENGVKSARLEYYDSEKKFKSRSNPKRVIILKNCFNINRRLDTKYSYVIALSTKEEVFCILLDSEKELNEWLRALLALQRGEDAESDPPKPNFEHVWQVQVERKGLAEEKGIVGKYHVCLTAKSVTLVRMGSAQTTLGENRLISVEFYLTTIRRCGDSQCFFYMEVGRHSAIGAGELWMQTEDPLIAQNMHRMIISAMTSSKNLDDGFGPVTRKRSASANSDSRPLPVIYRRQTLSGTKPNNSSPLNESPGATSSTLSSTNTIIHKPIKTRSSSKALEVPQSPAPTNSLNFSTVMQPKDLSSPQLSGIGSGRDRCDSLPSRNRTNSECCNSQSTTNSSMPPPSRPVISNRPMSMCIGSRLSHSPPINALSPSTGCSESDGSSLSIDEPDSYVHQMQDESGNFVSRYFSPHGSSGIILEENFDDPYFKSNKRIVENMNNANASLELPIASTTSNHNISKISPAPQAVDVQNQYVDMFSPYSPLGTSPCDHVGTTILPVSPSTEYPHGLHTGSSGGHSRASSLAEESMDGYVPICRKQMQDYVDMEQSSKQLTTSVVSSAASSCSVTSGTPSTDIRFSEYPLDKIKSRFTPDDEDLHSTTERPMRAYSVGSRPEHIKRKLRLESVNIADQNTSRVRAFSVGSRAKIPRCDLYRGVFAPSLAICINNNSYNDSLTTNNNNQSKGKKSSSAPLLAHKSQNSVDRMGDLMEIDFSKNSERQPYNANNINTISQQEVYGRNGAPMTHRLSSFPLAVPISQQNHDLFENSPKATSSGYLEMKPGSYSDKFSPTSSHRSMDSSGYLEMKPLSSSPIKASPSAHKPASSVAEEASYMNMSPPMSSFIVKKNNSEDYINISPRDLYIDAHHSQNKKVSSTPEGYMEMSFVRNKSNDQDLISNQYVKRPIGSCDASFPIDIAPKEKMPNASDPFSPLTSQGDMADSDFASIMFPFSPCTLGKNFLSNDFAQRKCLVDATSGTVTLSDQRQAEVMKRTGIEKSMSFRNCNILKEEANSQEIVVNVDTLSNNYADMSLKSGKEEPENVTHAGTESTSKNAVSLVSAKVHAVLDNKLNNDTRLQPVHPFGKNSMSFGTLSTTLLDSKKQIATVKTVSDSANNGFKPISSANDESLLKNSARNVNSNSLISRQFSDQLRTNENTSGYELLQIRSDSSLQSKKLLSRPNSVNSEKLSPLKTFNRPSSANSECLPSTSISSSTLCSSSSSATICESKSSLINPRPLSCSNTAAGPASTSHSDATGLLVDSVLPSRPPSVCSERELHYASLDLPPASVNVIVPSAANSDATGNSSFSKGNSSTSGESSTSPSPNASGIQKQPTFVYAEIDFNKSENLKMTLNGNNQKN